MLRSKAGAGGARWSLMFPLAAEILDTGLLNNNLLSDTFQLASVSRGALLFLRLGLRIKSYRGISNPN